MNEELTEALKRAKARHGGASGRRLAEIASANGFDVDRTQVNHILAGRYRSRPTRRTIDAIAFLAGIEPSDLYGLVFMPAVGSSFAEELPDEVDTLTASQRKTVLSLIRTFIAENASKALEISYNDAVKALGPDEGLKWLKTQFDNYVRGGEEHGGSAPIATAGEESATVRKIHQDRVIRPFDEERDAALEGDPTPPEQ